MLEDDKDQQLPATTVFSLAIQYLHDDVLNTCNEHLKKADLSKDDILWVLTVPAIWNDAAKQFMREAAEKVRTYSTVMCGRILYSFALKGQVVGWFNMVFICWLMYYMCCLRIYCRR